MWHTYREGVITPFHLLGQVLVIKNWQEGTVYLQQLFPPLRGLQTIFLIVDCILLCVRKDFNTGMCYMPGGLS